MKIKLTGIAGFLPAMLGLLAFGSSMRALGATSERREIEPDVARGRALAVVAGEGPLVHTAGFGAFDVRLQLVGGGDVARQTEQVLANIEKALLLGESSLDRVVKLNLAVREPAQCAEVEKVLARRFTKARPAVTLVVSEQTMPGALVSGDAVGLAGAGHRGKGWLYSKEIYRVGQQAHAAVLPTTTRIFLSGKGGKGPTAETTRSILAELKAAMDFVQVQPADIVQIRVFLQRVGETRQQDEAMTELFGSSGYPPVTYVDRAGDGSMEIEMIAGSPAPSKSVQQIEYLTPPKWKASPMFSQIARVNRGGLIYVSGLTGEPAADSETQARSIFERTEAAVRAGGGDMRYLAKALYYITGKEGGTGMDKLRPKVFAADRPPAASRNNLRHVGGEGGTMLIDMIGVVVE